MVIYVHPSGEAHTTDQAHQQALLINSIESFAERIREVARAFGELMKPLADAIRAAMTAAYKAVDLFGETFQEIEPSYRPINHYQRIYQSKHAGRYKAEQYNNKLKHASKSQRKPFKVFQRKL